MSPLEQAITTIRNLSAEEKRRLRDYLDAELAAPTLAETSPPPAPPSIFGWARDFVVVGEDFDAPLEDFREYM